MNKDGYIRLIFLVGILSLSLANLRGQPILIDRGVRANNFWCFPLGTDTLSYLFLPNEASLGLTDEGLPEFSFLRYVINVENEEEHANVITQAAGGALLHFLIRYDFEDNELWNTQFELQRILENQDVKLLGPIVFETGHYALISSILNEETGEEEQKLMTVGEAPVLAGSKLAFSFQLSPADSKLLLESFKMATPDISLMFDLSFSGYSEAYEAELLVNWSEVYDYTRNQEKHNYIFYSSEKDATIEEYLKTNAITLTTSGENDLMEGLIDAAYDRITEMIFQPVNLDEFRDKPEQGKILGMVLDKLIELASPASRTFKELSSLGYHSCYITKKIRKEGYSRISMNSRERAERHHIITFNIGDLYEKYGENEKVFKTVNLFDPDFQQREVYVGLDGSLISEFDEMVDNVTVTLKKVHTSGDSTINQILFNRETIGERMPKFIYGNLKDADRMDWLNYDYKTMWHFKGGASFETAWESSANAMINLFSPYEYRTIYIDGDLGAFPDLGIKATVITLEYSFFDKPVKEKMVIRIKDDLNEKSFEQTIPEGLYDYRYTIEWITEDGSYKKSYTDNTGIIFIDPPPGWRDKGNGIDEQD